MTVEDAAELTGASIAQVDAAAATGVIDARYFGWQLLVARLSQEPMSATTSRSRAGRTEAPSRWTSMAR